MLSYPGPGEEPRGICPDIARTSQGGSGGLGPQESSATIAHTSVPYTFLKMHQKMATAEAIVFAFNEGVAFHSQGSVLGFILKSVS